MAKNKKIKKTRIKDQQLKPTAPSQPSTQRKVREMTILTGSWKMNAGIFLLLLIGTVILYSGDLHIGFFDTDDTGYVTENPFIKSFSGENLKRIFAEPYFANYSPLHLLSYMIDYAFGGANPYIFHLSSNIWAGVVSGFVFLVALALTKNHFISIASAVLFIVHPVHVESIAWISSRKDIVATAFVLPCFLAYLKYRKANSKNLQWYGLSLLLFIFALGGKLSVATFPAVLFAYDLFIVKRPILKSLTDKIPFLIAAALFAMAVSSAQPPTGHKIDPSVLMNVMGQNFWLLTGFGTYVIYRIPPAGGGALLQLAGVVVILAIFILPLLLRRHWPMITVLIYWILFTFIPSQILSFIHPVTDRYLYLPSVGVVILIAIGFFHLAKLIGRKTNIAFASIVLVLSLFWTKNTLDYIGEWKDPRSVWYGATKKSSDAQVFSGLGIHYQNVSDRIGANPRGEPLPKSEAIAFAKTVWKDDPQLPELIADWNAGKQNGNAEAAFKKYMHKLSWDAFDRAIKTKTITMTNIYFRRGLILFDDGNYTEAKKEFNNAINEASHDTFTEGREEFTTRSYNALGIVAWREGDYKEALRLLKLAQAAQIRNERNWIPELDGNLKRLEGIIASQPQ